ncbi:MAG: peptidoglycan D,D-transpeptidase FtsI family protein [Candidatus Saccharimonadales bacterium]
MERSASLPSRSRLIVALMCLIGAIFVVRLFYLQVIQHEYYEAEALKEHVSKFTIPAKRGLIYAHDGTDKFAPLVLNEPMYTVYADPRYVKDVDKTVNVLRRIAGGNVVDNFENSLRDKERQYAVLARQVNKTQADLLEKEDLPGVGLQESDKRVYPEGQLAAHVLGFVNGEGQGQYGVEQALNDELSGKPGQLKAVTDVYGIPISIGDENIQTPAKQGKDLVLSLDRNVQAYAEQALKAGLERAKATRGSVIVMNPNNGHVMAMANLPTYNPNEYSKVKDFHAFQNRAISDPYEPGSVMKAFTMGTGLNENTVQPNSTFNNTGSTKVRDRTIKNVLTSPQGNVTMTQVLEYSFNTGVVHVLRTLGGGEINPTAKQKLYQYFTDHFFLGRKTDISLAGEATGEIVPPDTVAGGDVRYANMSFGQGMTATLLQVSAGLSAAVNGGTYYTPQVVSGHLNEKEKFVPKQPEIRKANVLTGESSQKLRGMLHDARSRSFLGHGDKPGYTIGGKTGTAQVFDPKTGTYSETETIGSYLGFGGQDKPEYVIMVRVDDAHISGYSGSAAAAPIFTDISNWMLDYLQIQPKG